MSKKLEFGGASLHFSFEFSLNKLKKLLAVLLPLEYTNFCIM